MFIEYWTGREITRQQAYMLGENHIQDEELVLNRLLAALNEKFRIERFALRSAIIHQPSHINDSVWVNRG